MALLSDKFTKKKAYDKKKTFFLPINEKSKALTLLFQ